MTMTALYRQDHLFIFVVSRRFFSGSSEEKIEGLTSAT